MRDAGLVLEEAEAVHELEEELAGAALREPAVARRPPRDVVKEVPAWSSGVVVEGGKGRSGSVVAFMPLVLLVVALLLPAPHLRPAGWPRPKYVQNRTQSCMGRARTGGPGRDDVNVEGVLSAWMVGFGSVPGHPLGPWPFSGRS